jgi:uncharacterized protein YjcR
MGQKPLTDEQREAADEWLDSFQTAKAVAEKYGTHESTLRYRIAP